MYRIFKDLLCCSGFYQMSQMKHPDPVRNIFHHGKVMCNKQISCLCLLLDIFHQIYHLCLDRHIKCRDTFIRNDQFRIHHQRSCDPDSLSLSSGKLMRISCCMLRGKSNLFQYFCNFIISVVKAFIHMMDVQPLSDDIRYFFSRIQTFHRILEDHLHIYS